MKRRFITTAFILASILCMAQSQWRGRRVAVIGDSISDSTRVGTTRCWWEMLADSLGFLPTCYAVNGATILDMQRQMEKTVKEQPEGRPWDLVLIFGGTNDFNASVPLGEIYATTREQTNKDGQECTLLHRSFITDNATFCGRVNNLLSAVKQHFPHTQTVLLTPIHRGYAAFGGQNVQPDELWANKEGLFPDQYIDVLCRASRAWAVPVVDLNVDCQLFPLYPSYDSTIHRTSTDRLHPNAEGHRRMALTVQGYLEHIYPFTPQP
ncbi:MAG: SGNH/GDSL hydrolase family protein [Bacteroidaceae bacterium]